MSAPAPVWARTVIALTNAASANSGSFSSSAARASESGRRSGQKSSRSSANGSVTAAGFASIANAALASSAA